MTHLVSSLAEYLGRCVAARIQKIDKTTCTMKFTQNNTAVVRELRKGDDVAGGVCEAMSCFWIYHHATDGSLWNWFLDSDQKVNLNALNEMMRLQEHSQFQPNQLATTDQWLKQHGVDRLPTTRVCASIGGNMTVGSAAASHDGKSSFFGPNELIHAITQDATTAGGKTGGQYKKISFTGKGGAHTVSAWIAEDVCYMDPNFGEFWFASTKDFESWFRKYWIRSAYALLMSGKFEIRSYGKNALAA